MIDYATISGESQAKLVAKRSTFVATAFGIAEFESGLEKVREISKRHPDAAHCCYALAMIGGARKSSDAGEPAGTAGTPIASAIEKNGVTNVACVVARRFGGIKLGASGLVAAYGKVASDAIRAAQRIRVKESRIYSFRIGYGALARLDAMLDERFKATERKYLAEAEVSIAVPLDLDAEFASRVNETFGGALRPVSTEIRLESYGERP